MASSPNGFRLCPFMLDRIQFGWVRRQIFQNMSRIKNRLLKYRRAYENGHCPWPLRIFQVLSATNPVLSKPKTHQHWHCRWIDKWWVNTCPVKHQWHSFALLLAQTAFTNRRIAVSAWHVVSKAAFVNIDDWRIRFLIKGYFIFKRLL